MQSVTGPPDAVVAGVKADHRIESGRRRLITVDKNASAPRITKRNRGGPNTIYIYSKTYLPVDYNLNKTQNAC